MSNDKIVAGFIGAGGIASSHAFSLNSLKYFYSNVPQIELAAVCSETNNSRTEFAKRYGFIKSCNLHEFSQDETINTVFVLGPNKVHYEHLNIAVEMKEIKRIYLEKPVCSSREEENSIRSLVLQYPQITIQVGFQYLFSPAVRDALKIWKTGIFGNPIHFDLKYYHGDYLTKDYRDKRASRLTPAPDGGAMADLGSHAASLLLAFMGAQIQVTGALQAGAFDDVPEESDLFSQACLYDPATGASGIISSSRVSSGTGDTLSLEIYAEKGAIRYSSATPDFFEYHTEEAGFWIKKHAGSDYRPITGFPSVHVPAGWHRSMIHAHYVFLNGGPSEPFIPDIEHGLQVQRLIRETAEHLVKFRGLRKEIKGHRRH